MVTALARSQVPIGPKDEAKGVFEVAAGFGERAALRVHTGDFFDVGDVPATALFDHGGERPRHSFSFSRTGCILA